jgi:hypothetical protein
LEKSWQRIHRIFRCFSTIKINKKNGLRGIR